MIIDIIQQGCHVAPTLILHVTCQHMAEVSVGVCLSLSLCIGHKELRISHNHTMCLDQIQHQVDIQKCVGVTL